MFARKYLTASCVATLMIFNVALSQAGQITGFTPYAGINSVAGVIIAVPVAPNNDDVAGISPNDLFVTQKHYVAIGAVDIVFDVVASGGVTEYSIREGVDNSTGLDWSDYRIELGFGVGADFVQSPSGDGLDFDAPSFNSPPDFTTFFSTVVEAEDELNATGGLFPSPGFSTPSFRFSIDVPDGITEFTLRQFPIENLVPEPTTAALLMISLVTLACRRRRSAIV